MVNSPSAGTLWCRFPTYPWYLLLLVPLPVVWWWLQAPHLYTWGYALRPLVLLYGLTLLIYLLGVSLLGNRHRAGLFTLMVILTEPAARLLLGHAQTLYLFIGTMGPVALPALNWAGFLLVLLALLGLVLLREGWSRAWSRVMLVAALSTASLMQWDPLWAAALLMGTIWGYLMVRAVWGRGLTLLLNGAMVVVWVLVLAHQLPWSLLQRLQQLREPPLSDTTPALKMASAPVIVQIQLQGYPRGDVLQANAFGDNHTFLTALQQHGFRVARDALLSHPRTDLALWSLWGMENRLFERVIEQPVPRVWLQWLVKQQMAQRPWLHFLRQQGYQIFYADAQQQAPYLADIGENLLAHTQNHAWLNPLEQRLLRAIPAPLVQDWLRRVSHEQLNQARHQALVYDYSTVPEGDPLFIMEHLALPELTLEVPYDDGLWMAHQRMRYKQALESLNQAIQMKIQLLKQRFKDRPLIILLHGGAMGQGVQWQKNRCLEHGFAPLLALYSRDAGWAQRPSQPMQWVDLYGVLKAQWFHQPWSPTHPRFYDQGNDAHSPIRHLPLWKLRSGCRSGLWANGQVDDTMTLRCTPTESPEDVLALFGLKPESDHYLRLSGEKLP
ncbi:hypothetical protein Mmc1_3549 [Magnetococcus marinus MC-1]|uniref:Uncharacterized protein n=2 Tax=Magnetococcus TaxID=162171 RepID=A0LDJ1_MAGMM|nr:hypothetical protein Mmc1_3549 [Magnetococcus marinus MC-1]